MPGFAVFPRTRSLGRGGCPTFRDTHLRDSHHKDFRVGGFYRRGLQESENPKTSSLDPKTQP